MSEKVRPIFQSEAELKQFLLTLDSDAWLAESSLLIMIQKAKQVGYILPDPVEEAEEMYEAFSNSDDRCASNILELIIKQHEAIQIMKPYYEKYKGEKI